MTLSEQQAIESYLPPRPPFPQRLYSTLCSVAVYKILDTIKYSCV